MSDKEELPPIMKCPHVAARPIFAVVTIVTRDDENRGYFPKSLTICAFCAGLMLGTIAHIASGTTPP